MQTITKELPTVSVVIATFNSEKLLPRTLQALKKQSYPKECMDILIVDGGSTDTTIKIAEKYACRVIPNPKTEPVHAKLLGAQNASGKYLVYLDHDEVLVNKNSIKNRVDALEKHPECKVAFLSGYKRPRHYPLLNQYISEFGDPFTLFMYGTPKYVGFFEKFLRTNCQTKQKKGYLTVSFKNLDKNVIIELCCMGTMINFDYFKENTKMCSDSSELVHLFYVMLNKGNTQTIMSQNDALLHYSVDSLRAYIPKLKWRIYNNIHFSEKADKGFTGREKFQKNDRIKKYLFPVYTVFLPVPIIHGIYLAATRKNPIYLLHPILCLYIVWEIGLQIVEKSVGIVPEFTSYDGKKKINR